MEQLLHYVWRHKVYPLAPLQTTDGQGVEVIDPGLPNSNAGPDFFNAKLKIGGTLWVGNVEVHVLASDWYRHGHGQDRAYDSVVLHVVDRPDCEVRRSDGVRIPQLVLHCPAVVRGRYEELHRAEVCPPCFSVLPTLSGLTVHSWFSALQAERSEQKADAIGQRLKLCDWNWEDAFFITLARNFGFGVNGGAFEAWAAGLPFRAVDRHRDSLFQVEAFFFGGAGLLEGDLPERDGYYRGLQGEYGYLCRKWGLRPRMSGVEWRFLRLRPDNFPHVRLAQLAWLYHRSGSLVSRVVEATSVEEVRGVLAAKTSPYWEGHFRFGRPSPHRERCVGRGALDLIVINTVVPFLYAYGRHKGDDVLCERANCFLESLRAEDNYIVRQWKGAGLVVSSAADSQALIQLQTQYCDRKDCLRCRFGYEFLRGSNLNY